ncbi:MAG: glycosyltransferase, partial [Deltaproteobacteria bacterium]|nr:glycosyltransferase [Kofleriaceae bacterium]
VSLGQGAALQTGIDHAVRRGAGHIVTFDGDGRHAPEDIAALVAALADADVALGSRFLGSVEGATRQRMMLLRTAVTVSSRLSGLRLSDARCGLRAFRAELAPRLRITQHRRAHASELLRKIERAGVRVVEVPCTLRYTAYSSKQGQGGLQAVRVLFDYFVRA